MNVIEHPTDLHTLTSILAPYTRQEKVILLVQFIRSALANFHTLDCEAAIAYCRFENINISYMEINSAEPRGYDQLWKYAVYSSECDINKLLAMLMVLSVNDWLHGSVGSLQADKINMSYNGYMLFLRCFDRLQMKLQDSNHDSRIATNFSELFCDSSNSPMIAFPSHTLVIPTRILNQEDNKMQ
jgi:hypothetical protein